MKQWQDVLGTAKLVNRGDPSLGSSDWKEGADHWSIRLERSGHSFVTVEYWTGCGCRAFPKNRKINTVDWWTMSKPVAPDVAQVLSSMASDAQVYQEARDQKEPLDWIMYEMSYNTPSECQALFDGCKRSHYNLRTLGLDEYDLEGIDE